MSKQPVEPGFLWAHRNGIVYTVLFLANDHTEHPDKYPEMVVYEGGNGKRWTRSLDDWHRSMTLIAHPPGQQEAEPCWDETAKRYMCVGDCPNPHTKTPIEQEAEPVAWTLRWPLDIKRGTVNHMTTFGTKERAREYADKCTDGGSIVVAPLILHQPKPAAQEAWLSDGQINEITLNRLGKWPSFEAQSWACKVVHAVAAQPADIDADELSNFIRKIDGNHSMGAGALAENIVEWIGTQAAQPQVPEGMIQVYIDDLARWRNVLRYAAHPQPSPHADDIDALLSAAKEE